MAEIRKAFRLASVFSGTFDQLMTKNEHMLARPTEKGRIYSRQDLSHS